MTAKIAKGKLVRLNPTKCFTTKQGGGLQYPRTNYNHDEAGTVPSSRPTTRRSSKPGIRLTRPRG